MTTQNEVVSELFGSPQVKPAKKEKKAPAKAAKPAKRAKKSKRARKPQAPRASSALVRPLRRLETELVAKLAAVRAQIKRTRRLA